MGGAGAADPTAEAGWSPAAAGDAGGAERDLLCGPHRLPVALPAQGVPEREARLLVLHSLAGRRHLGANHRCAAAPVRAGRGAERRDSGQPIGEDHPKGGIRGYDANKKVNGRKRHLLVDTEGLVLRVVVLPADLQDRDGAQDVCHVAAPICPRLAHIWADQGYAGWLVAWVREAYGWRLEIVRKPPNQVGFVVQPRRWVVERTFAWLATYRRLSKDYEELPESSEAWVYAASIHLMLKRLAPALAFQSASEVAIRL